MNKFLASLASLRPIDFEPATWMSVSRFETLGLASLGQCSESVGDL